MSKKSDKHEHYVASSINAIDGVTAVRPVKGTDYSDVLIDYRGNTAWLEVKMNHKDNLANPRVYYHEKEWKTRYITPLAHDIVKELNNNEDSRAFVYSISDYSKLSLEAIYIPTLRSEMDTANSVPRPTMRSFCKERGGYILDFQDRDLTEYVTKHYVYGKTEPAFYMQAGDDFFMISNTNPLGLSTKIPVLEGTGKFRVRVSNRSKFYEIQGELKMMNLVKSEYSVLPNSCKNNPFM